MVTKTAREILESAKYLAGVRNSNMSDFFQVVNILNNIYKDVYRRICAANSTNIRDYHIEGSEWEIPREVYAIADVYFKNPDGIGVSITRGSYLSESFGETYQLYNNKVKLNFPNQGNVYVKCIMLPESITCPSDPIEAPNGVTAEDGYLIDGKYYFKLDDEWKVWDIKNNEISDSEEPNKLSWSSTFGEKKVSKFQPAKGHIIIENKDATATFIVEEDVKIVAATFCDPYAMVSYDNGHTYLFQFVEDKVQWTRWNPDSYTGHDTLASVIALHTNDYTGEGVVYLDKVDGKIKYGSFVPDTIISSPSNIIFTFLETKLAAYLLSITGSTNDYITADLLINTEQELYNSIPTDANPGRVKNVMARCRRI